MKALRGTDLKGSTAHVLEHSLPKIVYRYLDSARMPAKLNWEVKLNWIPAAVYQKAADLVELADPSRNKLCRFTLHGASPRVSRVENNARQYASIYILSSKSKFTKIDDVLISKYEAALRGERPTRTKTWAAYIDVCKCMYKLEVASDSKACIPSRPTLTSCSAPATLGATMVCAGTYLLPPTC